MRIDVRCDLRPVLLLLCVHATTVEVSFGWTSNCVAATAAAVVVVVGTAVTFDFTLALSVTSDVPVKRLRLMRDILILITPGLTIAAHCGLTAAIFVCNSAIHTPVNI